MPLRNRVTPFGELISDPARGLVYGNRGCLHDAAGHIRRRYAVRRWIACRLEFKGRRRSPLMVPGRYTELFFLDEATAFAAGHRPCAECRREDYNRFSALWSALHPGAVGADAIDELLHAERFDSQGREPRLHELPFDDLPDGTFVVADEQAWLVLGDELLEWTPAGYVGERWPRPRGQTAVVLTPPSLVAILRAGWRGAVPLLHPTTRAPVDDSWH
ncbi:MAG TPA: hypothetical protein VHX62_05090 [Solirubrobacteraceae bacterium]|jgi:hypothetical protein|nr:hypothetical protein [Solirubrobacteraceae bacterium]